MSSPLEAMYPNRCFDCLAVCPHEKTLCANCEAGYAVERERQRRRRTKGDERE